MKSSVLTKALQVTTLIAMASCATAEAGTSRATCSKLKGSIGIYHVSNGEREVITKLDNGTQSVGWGRSNWIYFVVGESDGKSETVDHFRIMTIAERGDAADTLRVGIDRNAVDSDCATLLQKIFGNGEYHESTSLDHYNKRMRPEYKNIDNKLNKWHFLWNNAQRGEKLRCAHTSAYTPTIGESDDSPEPASNLIGAAIAATAAKGKRLPRNLASFKMVLVHRREDQTNCVAVRLDSGISPAKTVIHRLRFGNQKKGFSGSGATVLWVK